MNAIMQQEAQERYQERPDRLALACAIFPAVYASAVSPGNDPPAGEHWKMEMCVEVWRLADTMMNARHVSG